MLFLAHVFAAQSHLFHTAKGMLGFKGFHIRGFRLDESCDCGQTRPNIMMSGCYFVL